MQTEPQPAAAVRASFDSKSFGRALDALRSEVESQLGEVDLEHARRIRKLSRALEVVGRACIHFSIDPVTFSTGVTALSAHKALELMERGHMVLHGVYDRLTDDPTLHADTFAWKAPIDEGSWRTAHNIRHHQYTNIEGRDPDLDFGALRLSGRVPFKKAHRLQPVTNVLTWFGFASAINLHVTGMLDLYLSDGPPLNLKDRSAESKREAHKKFLKKAARYYGREFVFFPLLAGPFFWKTILGNLASDVARDLYAAATIYCGHVGAEDFAPGSHAKGRADWYAMQVRAARNIAVPHWVSVLCGGLDKQIEHHLFPRLPPNRLREIAPRVKAICEQHGLDYQIDSWPVALRDVLGQLYKLSAPHLEVAEEPLHEVA